MWDKILYDIFQVILWGDTTSGSVLLYAIVWCSIGTIWWSLVSFTPPLPPCDCCILLKHLFFLNILIHMFFIGIFCKCYCKSGFILHVWPLFKKAHNIYRKWNGGFGRITVSSVTHRIIWDQFIGYIVSYFIAYPLNRCPWRWMDTTVRHLFNAIIGYNDICLMDTSSKTI